MDSTATSGGQPWAGGDEWEEVCPPASTRLVGGRRKQTKQTPAILAGVHTLILKRNGLLDKPPTHNCRNTQHRDAQREDQAGYLQWIEGCHAGYKFGALQPVEYTRLLQQDDDHRQDPNDRKNEYAGFFGSVAQVQRRNDGTVETPVKETIEGVVQQILRARLQFRIEWHHQENQNERQPHRNQRRHQDQQQFLDHVILLAYRQGEQIEEAVVFLVIENRRRGRRDEKERHHYKYQRNGFDRVGVESRDQHEHKQCFQLLLQ